MAIRLIVESGQPAGESYELTDGEHLVGRGSDCQFKLTSSGVSRQQLRFSVQGDKVTVENLSQYGSQLEGRDLIESVPVKPGQRLTLGLYTILRVEGDAPEDLDPMEESSIWDVSSPGLDPADDLLVSDVVPDESDMTDPGAMRSIDHNAESGFVDIWAHDVSDQDGEGDSAILFTQAAGADFQESIGNLGQTESPAAPEAPLDLNALSPSQGPKTQGLSPEAVDYLRRQWDRQAKKKSRMPWIVALVLLLLLAIAGGVAALVLK